MVDTLRRARSTAAPVGIPAVLVGGAVVVASSALLVVLIGVTNGFAAAVPFTSWLLPIARLAMDLAAVATIGALLFATVLVPPRAGRLAPGELQVMRVAGWWAAAWAAAALASAVLTASDIAGVDLVTAAAPAALGDFLLHESHGRALVVVVVLATSLAIAAMRARTLDDARFLLVLALVAVLPPTQTGHAAEAGFHHLALGTLMVHVVAVSLWFGGLAALVLFGRGSPALGSAAGRFSRLALGCFVAAGLTGGLNAWIRLGGGGFSVGQLTGSVYGRFVVGKLLALVVLGGVGWWHRRRTLPGVAAGRPGAFRRFALGELVVMVLTVALAVALSRTPPPALLDLDQPSVEQVTPQWPCSTDPVLLLRTEERSDVVRWAHLCNSS